MTDRLLDAEQLDRFLYQVADLRRRTLVQQGLFTPLTLEWKATDVDPSESGARSGTWSISGYGPENDLDTDLWRSFLMNFRLFTADKEPVFLGRILNVAQRHIADAELLDQLRAIRLAWRKVRGRGTIQLEINGELMTGHKLWRLWIVGVYFHTTEPGLTAFIQGLDPFLQKLLHGLFRRYVLITTGAVLATADVIEVAKERAT